MKTRGFSRTLIIAAALTLCARVALAESAVETWTVDGVKREAIAVGARPRNSRRSTDAMMLWRPRNHQCHFSR